MTPPVWLFWESESVLSPGVEWTPAYISDLVVWLDADDTAFSNNDAVDSWINKGSGGDAEQTDSAKRPIFKTNLLNGKPGVDFDGTNDHLQISSLALDTYISLFVVAKTTTAKPIFIEHSATANSNDGFYFYGASGNHYNVRRTSRNSYSGTSGWFGSTAAQAALVIDAISTPSPMGKVYLNGALQSDGSAAFSNSLADTSVTDTLNIFSRDGASSFSDGDLHELIIYNKPLAQADREKVEGYLAWKWGLEGNLPLDHPYKSAAPTVSTWTPSDFTSLQCWLDASDSTTLFDALTGGSLPGDNGSIGRWEDKSGNGYHADDALDISAQKISTTRPTRVIAAQNGLDAINFASQGFDHYLSGPMLRNRSSALVAHVSKYNGTSGGGSWIWSHEEYNDNKKRFQLGRFSLGSQRLDANDAAVRVYGTSDGTSSGTSDTDWHVHVGVLDWASGTMEYFIDGESKGSASYTSGSGNTGNTNVIGNTNYHRAVIGITQSASATFSKVPDGTRIGELICVAQSSGSYAVEDREKLEGYLAHKWGLAANLPANHPYKNFAP
jgi:hypothetical protein